MNRRKYLIEWRYVAYEEWDDKWAVSPFGEIHNEIFEDECEFNKRYRELTDLEIYHEVIIDGCYTCELTRITDK